MVETLRSIQYLLFPYEDLKSTKILDQLIQRDGFDAECAEYDDYALDGLDEDKYLYWGQRIAALHKVIDNRPPRNSLERWLQRHDTDRYLWSSGDMGREQGRRGKDHKVVARLTTRHSYDGNS